ncbi:aminotransferase class III-fold pyridoxal phosphate-dependent enzyme [Candidatus Woesearchaeota archaeon]|jgi:glutamate-1-semialdehyde aminotransferase|nr:aminotransferase class III-fold pyridoxal phosphate-dependent enzyme [Candidatus Woesearchaeota archaeon]
MIKPRKLNISKSNNYWNRAIKVLPNGCMTISNGPMSYTSNVSPKYNLKGKGCHIWDVDGNKFLDLAPGGYLKILGYNYKPLTKEIVKNVKRGSIFQMPHPLEVETAETIVNTIPSAEMVKFAKNGADVLTMGIRAARAYTGRDIIASEGYHGIHDWYIGTTERNKGVPNAVKKLTKTFEYNNIESLKKIFDENKGKIACVVLEPVQLTPPKDNFLHKVQKLAHDNGAVLMFDEIITGFRFSLQGAQGHFGIKPDLSAFGKAMTNGYSCSALVGKADIMMEFEKGAFFSTTYGGETIGLAAAKKTIEIMKEKRVHSHLWKMGRLLKNGINKTLKELNLEDHYECYGYPIWTQIKVKENEKGTTNEKTGILIQEAMQRGMLAGLFHGISYSHKKKDILKGIEIYREALKPVKRYIEEGTIQKYLRGVYGGKVFRKVG